MTLTGPPGVNVILTAALNTNVLQHCLADVWVTRTSEVGLNDAQYHCRTHLGHLLRAGDLVMG